MDSVPRPTVLVHKRENKQVQASSSSLIISPIDCDVLVIQHSALQTKLEGKTKLMPNTAYRHWDLPKIKK